MCGFPRQEHYDVSEALSCVLHSSIALHKDMEARPLSLEKCLDTFTAQEDIKEVRGAPLLSIFYPVARAAGCGVETIGLGPF